MLLIFSVFIVIWQFKFDQNYEKLPGNI